MTPFFSVIIPLYNKEKFIRNTLESVLRQTFSDYEIIIVNDGSSDKSGSIVKELFNEKIRYVETGNKGVSAARNTGISLAKGEYIAFLDADDYWYPFFLEEIHSYIVRFPEQKVFATAIEFEYQGRITNGIYSIKKTEEYEIVNYFDASLEQSVIFTSATAFHKDVFVKTGDFDKGIKSGQDIDMWIRIGLYFNVLFIWKICVRYTYDIQSLSRNIESIKDKVNFSKFADLEKKNLPLKRFVDYNRFSLAIKSRLIGDMKSFQYFRERIDLKNLPLRKRILLFLPKEILDKLINIKNMWMKFGFGKSIFVK